MAEAANVYDQFDEPEPPAPAPAAAPTTAAATTEPNPYNEPNPYDQFDEPETSGPGAFVKGVGQAALEIPGQVLQGVATQTAIPRTMGEIGRQAATIPFDPGAIGRIAVGIYKDAFGKPAEPPVSESPVYRAGEAEQKWAQQTVPITPQEQAEHPIYTGVGRGVGSMAGALVAGRASPALGIAIATTQFGLTGAGDTYKAAKEHGASEETAKEAATYSMGINAAMGMLPAGVVFKPLESFMPQAMPLVGKILYEAGRDGVVFTGIGELGEYVGQKLAQMYDPKAHYEFDINRLAASFLTGGIFGAAHGVFGHGEAPAAAEKPPAEAPGAPAEAQPAQTAPPKTGAEAIGPLLGPEPESESILPPVEERQQTRGPIEPTDRPQDIVNPVDPSLPPEQKAARLHELTEENKPLVEDFIKGIDKEFGTESKSNEKEQENILSKAKRPSIIDKKPWHDVEHIRDSFRFKTVLDDLRTLPDIVSRLEPAGFEIVKRDTSKVMEPMEWGWRIASFDLRAPNGQLIEYYLPIKELETAKAAGHKIFEKWRNVPFAELTPERMAERQVDMRRSNDLYQDAWDASLKRLGIQESDLRASLNAVSTAPGSVTGLKSSATSPEVQPLTGRQTPPDLRASNLEPASKTYTTEGSSRETYAPTGDFSNAINRNIGPDGTVSKAVPSIPPHRVTTASGQTVDVAPIVVEADQLRTSQDPGYDQSLQPRQRDRAASQQQVRDIATNLDPERLGYSSEADRGAPIVGPDGMVESGNGRVLALRQVYGADRRAPSNAALAANRYRNWLAQQGVDVSQYRNPVLVRMRTTPLTADQRRAFTVGANQAATLAMSIPERALADAGRITPEMLSLISNPDDLAAVSNRQFMRRFVAGLPQSEQGGMVDAKGQLSAEGLQRVRNAILAKAYDDSATLTRISESIDGEVKSISNAMVASAPQWAKFRAEVEAGRVRPDMDLTPQLLDAVARTADIRGKGIRVDDYLAQLDAFERPSRAVEDFMQAFYDPKTRRAASAQKIADELRFFAQEASKVTRETGLNLGMTPINGEQITRALRDRRERDARRELPNRGGAGAGAGDEAARGEVRGFEFGAEGEGAGEGREGGPGEEAVRAQRPTEEELRRLGLEEVPLAGGKRGLQQVIPGAEKLSSAELAKRRAAQPMGARVPQEMPGGLFGDLLGQEELFRRAPTEMVAPPPRREGAPGVTGGQEGVANVAPPESPVAPAALTQPVTVSHSATDLFGVAQSGKGAFPNKVSSLPLKQVAPPKRKPKAKETGALFDWEVPNERREPEIAGTPALAGMAPGEGEAIEGRGPTERGTPGGGDLRPAGDRNLDAEGLLDRRGEGSGVAPIYPPGAGGRPERGPVTGADRGTRGEETRVPEEPARPVKPSQAPNVPAIDYRITDETELGKGTEGVKYRDNLAAIETLKRIEREERRPTPDEQRTLARYVGWGGMANAFAGEGGKFKPDWADRGQRLADLLTKDELAAARHSTPNAHYTSKPVVDAMWRIADRLGFKGGLALESSMGTGNFIGLTPEKIAGRTKFVGVELDGITARIAKALYPQQTIIHSGFQRVPLPDGEFTLNIGNPPFGSESLRFQDKPELNGLSIHNQFFLAGLDALQPGGLHVAIVSHHLLDAQDQSARQKMAVKADLLGAIRLPDTAFKENARTEVVTDLVVMQRRTPEDERAMEDLIRRMNEPGRSKEAEERRDHSREQFNDKAPWIQTSEIADPLGGDRMPVNTYFAQHPDMIVGRMERSGSMRGPDQVNVKLGRPEDFNALLNAAVDRMPRDVLDLDKKAVDRTLDRFNTLSDSLRIAMERHEPGHLEYRDGNLTQIMERETPRGEFELTRRTVDPAMPWSPKLTMDADGKWYTLEPSLDTKGKKIKQGNRLVYERKYYPNNEVPPGMRLGQARFDNISSMTRLRDLLKKQIMLETEDAPAKDMEDNRGQLAAAYRAYADEHGLLNDPNNMRLLNDMPDGPLLMSLESGYRAAVSAEKAARSGQKARAASAEPAAILSKRVIQKYEPPTKAGTPAEAVGISLSERGRLDPERIGELLGLPEDQVREALTTGDQPLAYHDPETNQLEPASGYLSGQVRRKLAAARLAGLDQNVKALEAVQPVEWTADQVTPLIASNWVPPRVYEDFAKHLLGVDDATVNYSKATNSYNFLTGEISEAKHAEWGTPDMPPDAILRGMLNSRLPKVMRETHDDPPRRYEDKEASGLVALKAREIASNFGDWIFSDADRRRALVKDYNDRFNTRTPRQHDGRHLTLPGKNPDISLRRHILNAIWRGIYERNMLVDHIVGAGKTFTAIGRIMERRRLGLSQKPMIAVPNHLVSQWATEFLRLYPGAKVLAAGTNQFNKQNRRRLFAKIATGDWDAVVVPHSSFGFIGISPETELRFLDEQLRVAREAVTEAEEASAGQGGFRKPYTVKEAERLVSSIESKMDAIRGKRRDGMLTFEQMGVDDLTVDEAHEFKNLFYSSRMTGVRGMGDKSGSQKAFDLYNKIKVLNDSPRGSTVFLTGTPISNSAVEMYTMMRYLSAKELQNLGMEHFDAWRSQFVSAEPKWEPTESGGLKEVTRLGRSWSNMRALMDLYHSFTDSVTQEDINRWYAEDNGGADFPIPKVEGGERKTQVVQPTPAQQRILKDVIAGFDGLPDITDPDERNAERLRLMDRARKVSLDARAVDPRNPSKEEGGKLEAIADNAAKIYKRWNTDKGTQLIFLDRSVPKAAGDDQIIKAYDALIAKRDKALADHDEDAFQEANDDLDKFNPNEIAELRAAQDGGWNAYQQIKDNLVARGVPANEIRFVQEAKNEKEKQALFDAVNDGEVRILLGSTQRMGAGTNVQKRIVAIHHGDVTWKPSDIEQREGRGIRQGNSLYDKYGGNFELGIHSYVTERTVDAKMWDLNAEKLRMINGIRKYDGSFNMEFADEDAVSMAEVAALASGDPLLMERVKLAGEIEKLEIQDRGFRRKMNGIEDTIDSAKAIIRDYPDKIKELRASSDDMRGRLRDLNETAGKRSVTIDGKTYHSRFDAMHAVQEIIDAVKAKDENAKYEVKVGGQPLTSKEAIQSAINATLGDKEPFEATIGGEAYRSRWGAVSAIADAIKPQIADLAEVKAIPLGRMLGADLEARVEPRGADHVYLTLALKDAADRTIAAADMNVEKEKPVALAVLNSLEKDAKEVANSRGDWMQDRIEKAKKDLPELTKQLQPESPVAGKLTEMRGRLRDLIQTLDERTQAKEHGDLTEEVEARRGEAGQTERPEGQEVRLGPGTFGYLKPEFTEAEGKIAEAVQAIGKRLAPQATVKGASAIRQDGQRIWGAFVNSKRFPQLVAWSLEKGRPAEIAQTVRHEIIHHLRAAGLIRPAEWDALAAAAKKDGWLDKYQINERYGDLNEDKRIEEAVADHFGHWRENPEIEKPGLIRSAFNRMNLLMKQTAAAVRRIMGKDATPDDIFTRIETGEVGRRESKQIEAQRVAAERPQKEEKEAPTPKLSPIERIAQQKQVKAFWKGWASTFQPEMVSDKAFDADPIFAAFRARRSNARDLVTHYLKNDWAYWNKKTRDEKLKWIDDMENGRTPADPEQARMAKVYKNLIERNYQNEKQLGSQAAYVQDYFPHIWEQVREAANWAKTQTMQLGPRWFQKKRSIDFINEGLAAGLKLKYDNPIDMLQHRFMSGVDMRLRMELLQNLRKSGLAWETRQRIDAGERLPEQPEDLPAAAGNDPNLFGFEPKERGKTPKQLPLLDTVAGRTLIKKGWRAINAPDGKQWLIAPDIQPLWDNAVQAQSLWQSASLGGQAFRGWMAIKNLWVPLKLAVSLFHPVHVLHINQSQHLAMAAYKVQHGRDFAGALGELAQTPFGGFYSDVKRGSAAKQAWFTPPDQRTPEQRGIVQALTEGGMRPGIPEEMKIKAVKSAKEALGKIQRGEAGAADWMKFTAASMGVALEKMQGLIFEKWIPALKVSAYLDQTAALMKARPELLQNDVERRTALRAIAKSIDNRYGEMNYDTLFWNRYAKEGGIASFLSLGWNLGFAREFLSAPIEAGVHGMEKLVGAKVSPGRASARDASNKLAFATAYVGSAALIAGTMTYLFTGDTPSGLDWIFPRIGGQNPDGSARRVTTMFYTREVPMLLKHIQDQGGNWLTGSGEMLWNKLMFQPFVELLNNRDYYGYNIWDTNAPVYKQAWQGITHFLGQQVSPMALTGGEHAAELSGKEWPSITEAVKHPSKLLDAITAKGVGLSFVGFGPAPAYVEKTALQNRIGNLYQRFVPPTEKPAQQGENLRERMAVRQAIMIAKRDHDLKALAEANKRGLAIGMTQKQLGNIGKTPGDVYMFSRLPDELQLDILRRASPEEKKRYFPKAHRKVLAALGREDIKSDKEDDEDEGRATGGAVQPDNMGPETQSERIQGAFDELDRQQSNNPNLSVPYAPPPDLSGNVIRPGSKGWKSIGRRVERAAGGAVLAHNINHEPTPAQAKAGNYAKDHLHWNGLPLTIENACGSKRHGVGPDGKPWECRLPAHYGYVKNTEGADGDHVDVYLGPHPKASKVYVIDQVDAETGKFDETKTMLGFSSTKQALHTYMRAFSDGRGHERIGNVTPMPIEAFKHWLEHGHPEKPIKEKRSHASAEYVDRSTKPGERCGLCSMFIGSEYGGPACTDVIQPIKPGGYCRLFSKGKLDA